MLALIKTLFVLLVIAPFFGFSKSHPGQYTFYVKFVCFNLDDSHNLWHSHIKKRTPDWINVSEGSKFRESKIAKQFVLPSIPSAILVSREGFILYTPINVDPDFKKIDELLSTTN